MGMIIQRRLPDMTDVSTLSSVLGNSTPVNSPQEETDYVFTTLNGYQVTVGAFIFNLTVIILGIWIIILNCLLIETLVRFRAHLEVTDIFIHSLAATDALTGLLLLYNSAYNILNFQNRYECFIRFGLIQSMSLASNGFIAQLTINRYVMVSQPFHYKKIFQKKLMIVLTVFTWCISIIIGFLPLMGWSRETAPEKDDNGQMVCRFFGIMDPNYLWLTVALYWLPVILMVVLYTHMCKIACYHAEAIKKHEQAVTNKHEKIFERHSWRLTKTVSIVIGIYLCCWMPTGGYIYFFQLTVNVLKFQTLVACQKGIDKQCRPRSGCF